MKIAASSRSLRLLASLLLAACAINAPAREAAPPPARPAPRWDHEWARGAVFYEVFVRSFQDSNGDGIGDIQGLISRLDALNDGNPATGSDLGVDALWLMPVFDSPSYHGYDVVDYEKIEPDYGTEADFDRLLAEAHKRGISVIVDFVLNHSSSQHPWFAESASSPSSPRRNWYLWCADDPGWRQPWGGSSHTWHAKNGAFYYGIFWGGMPDLNYSTPAVRQEMERVAAFWLRRGVDGFRLDATRHLFANGPGEMQNDQPETFEYLQEFASQVRRVAPRSVLVGENRTETPVIARYYESLPMSFNFPLASAILEGVKAGDAAGIGAKLQEMTELYPPDVIDTPFLTNHDMKRAATELGNEPARLRSAAAVLLTLPGAPFLYYGEEVGLQNGPGGNDEFKRTPMPWDATPGGGFTTGKPWFELAPGKETANVAAQAADPGSLLSWYRQLIRARKGSSALRSGTLSLLSPADLSTPVLAFVREAGPVRRQERALVAHNLSGSEAEAGPYALPGRTAVPILTSPGTPAPVRSAGGWTVRLPEGPAGSGGCGKTGLRLPVDSVRKECSRPGP